MLMFNPARICNFDSKAISDWLNHMVKPGQPEPYGFSQSEVVLFSIASK